MVSFASYVFLDLETTGFIKGNDKPKITELAMISVKTSHILSSEMGELPRIMHKLVLSFNPIIKIRPPVPQITGIYDETVENDKYFDEDAVDLLSAFLKRQPAPICFVAHNGHRFDFPILKAEIFNNSTQFPFVYYVDSLKFFQDMTKSDNPSQNRLSFKLIDVYLRTFGEGFSGSHCAESDVLALLKCCIARCQSFVDWSQENHKIFDESAKVKPLFDVVCDNNLIANPDSQTD